MIVNALWKLSIVVDHKGARFCTASSIFDWSLARAISDGSVMSVTWLRIQNYTWSVTNESIISKAAWNFFCCKIGGVYCVFNYVCGVSLTILVCVFVWSVREYLLHKGFHWYDCTKITRCYYILESCSLFKLNFWPVWIRFVVNYSDVFMLSFFD